MHVIHHSHTWKGAGGGGGGGVLQYNLRSFDKFEPKLCVGHRNSMQVETNRNTGLQCQETHLQSCSSVPRTEATVFRYRPCSCRVQRPPFEIGLVEHSVFKLCSRLAFEGISLVALISSFDYTKGFLEKQLH